MNTPNYYASIDLGSNSFHMLIGRINNGQLEVIDREKEMVQIARGLDASGKLDDDAKQRALDCLHRFSERLRDIPPTQIRAVGTKTLRSIHRSGTFLRQAAKQLGHPIQIISGYEEARLVYSGLAHSIVNNTEQRLVIDIGGGSTEFIIGVDYDAKLLESLSLGCVAYTKSYFSNDDSISKSISASMDNAYRAACSELEQIRKSYVKRGWDIAYGTSGTIKAIGELVGNDGSSVIRYEDLDRLQFDVIRNNGVHSTNISKLRRNVLPAGVSILKAIFDQLKIKELHAASPTLKEGLIFDTVGRLADQDTRESTVSNLMQRYSIEVEQAQRVGNTALSLWQNIKESSPDLSGISRTKVLKWAAHLHEIGLSVSHSSHHNHGFYLLQHSDLAGFGRYEQYAIAALVRMHRKKVKSDIFFEMHEDVREALKPILLCLRLAVRLHRCRDDIHSPIEFSRKDTHFLIRFEKNWLAENPLTRDGLFREIQLLNAIDLTLVVEEH